MNLENEIHSLSGETLALQTLVTNLCVALLAHDPTLRRPITLAFDASAGFVEDFAITAGKSANPEHTVKAIRIVEELRSVVLGDKTEPRHGV